MKILVRGDCCSRRAFMLNRNRFDFHYQIVSNEKAPNAVFCDTLKGLNPERSVIEQFVDTSKMGKSQAGYFERQFERTILTETDAALLVMDPYSEMNFQLWKHKEAGWRFWAPNASIRNMKEFSEIFESDGYRTLTQSFQDSLAVVDHIRSNNPGIPVLYLTQPLEYYPKLERKQFYELGSLLETQRDRIFAGANLAYEALVPDDLGTGGRPDWTLHFSGDTYYQMMAPCLDRGLLQAIRDRDRVIAPTGVVNESAARSATRPTATPAGSSPEVSSRPPLELSFAKDSATCLPTCDGLVEKLKSNLEQYVDVVAPGFVRTRPIKYDCAVINLDDYPSYAEYEHLVWQSGKGNRIRLIKKAEQAGFFCDTFAWKMHIPDIYEINTSKKVRSGGEMKSSYMRTVDELGGAPTKTIMLVEPACSNHWSIPFGVFKHEEGYCQGTEVVNRRLYGYILLHRRGELAIYSLIIGHGDYLGLGTINLLHHHVMKWLLARDNRHSAGIKTVMYAGIDQGTQGLRDWKRREGFVGVKLIATD